MALRHIRHAKISRLPRLRIKLRTLGLWDLRDYQLRHHGMPGSNLCVLYSSHYCPSSFLPADNCLLLYQQVPSWQLLLSEAVSFLLQKMCHQQPQQMCPLSKFTAFSEKDSGGEWSHIQWALTNTSSSSCCKIITKILLNQHYVQTMMLLEAKTSCCKKSEHRTRACQWLR